jgi:hypothetical protein
LVELQQKQAPDGRRIEPEVKSYEYSAMKSFVNQVDPKN